LFSIIYVEYEKYHYYTDIISTTEEDLQKLKRELPKLTQKELVIMYKGIFSLPDSTKVTEIEYVLIDAIINETKVHEIIERELQKLTRKELVIMYKGIFSLPDSTKFTAIQNVLIDAIKDVLIDAIINETKVPEIIESIKTYPRDSGGAKNKKRTTIKSGHTLLRKTKHTNRNKIYRNKIYRNTKRIRQTKKR